MTENLRTTLLVAMIAVAMTVAAVAYYPWQQAVGAKSVENTNLIEEYETDKVRKIEIKEMSEDNRLRQITLVRKGRQWTIPSRFDFPAENIRRINAVSECLKNLMVHELKSEEKKDHQDSGVLDPDDSAGRAVGIGTKLVLYDRSNQVLGSLIIGKKEGGEDQPKPGEKDKYTVRIPGQPGIFLVDFEKQILSTNFRDWINPNLIDFGTTEKRALALTLKNQIIAPETLTDDQTGNETAELNYVTRILIPPRTDIPWGCDRLEIAKEGKILTPLKTQRNKVKFEPDQAAKAISRIYMMPIANVLKMPEALAEKFRNLGKQALQPGDLKNLAGAGFLVNSEQEIQGVRGKLVLTTESGVDIHFILGKVTSGQTSNELHRYMIAFARVNEQLNKAPEPISAEDQKIEEKDVAYKKALQQYQERLQIAGNVAGSFNQTVSEWIFRIDERATKELMPESDQLFDLSQLEPEPEQNKKDDSQSAETKKGSGEDGDDKGDSDQNRSESKEKPVDTPKASDQLAKGKGAKKDSNKKDSNKKDSNKN